MLQSPQLQLRFAQANYEKTWQQWLELENKVQSFDKKLTDALETRQEAKEQQAAAINDPEQYRAASLVIEETTVLIQSLNNDLDREESYFPACKKALKTAKATLREARDLCSTTYLGSVSYAAQDTVNNARTRSIFHASYNQPLAPPLVSVQVHPLNDEQQTPSSIHCHATTTPSSASTNYSILYGHESIEMFLSPAPTLGSRCDSAPPILSIAQPLPAQRPLQMTYRKLDTMIEGALTNFPVLPA